MELILRFMLCSQIIRGEGLCDEIRCAKCGIFALPARGGKPRYDIFRPAPCNFVPLPLFPPIFPFFSFSSSICMNCALISAVLRRFSEHAGCRRERWVTVILRLINHSLHLSTAIGSVLWILRVVGLGATKTYTHDMPIIWGRFDLSYFGS